VPFFGLQFEPIVQWVSLSKGPRSSSRGAESRPAWCRRTCCAQNWSLIKIGDNPFPLILIEHDDNGLVGKWHIFGTIEVFGSGGHGDSSFPWLPAGESGIPRPSGTWMTRDSGVKTHRDSQGKNFQGIKATTFSRILTQFQRLAACWRYRLCFVFVVRMTCVDYSVVNLVRSNKMINHLGWFESQPFMISNWGCFCPRNIPHNLSHDYRTM